MKDNRKQQILNLLTARGYTNVTELASRFNVTTETIRRDLNELEQENLVKRIHGGAIAAAKRSSELEYQNRGQYLMQEKKDIARKAAELINDGETVVITSGTTTQAMAEFLLQKGLIGVQDDFLALGVYREVGKAASQGQRTGVLCTDETVSHIRADVIKNAGSRADEHEIARNIYRILREFDDEGVDVIFSESFSADGFGQAVMNRLLKAAGYKVKKI